MKIYFALSVELKSCSIAAFHCHWICSLPWNSTMIHDPTFQFAGTIRRSPSTHIQFHFRITFRSLTVGKSGEVTFKKHWTYTLTATRDAYLSDIWKRERPKVSKECVVSSHDCLNTQQVLLYRFDQKFSHASQQSKMNSSPVVVTGHLKLWTVWQLEHKNNGSKVKTGKPRHPRETWVVRDHPKSSQGYPRTGVLFPDALVNSLQLAMIKVR